MKFTKAGRLLLTCVIGGGYANKHQTGSVSFPSAGGFVAQRLCTNSSGDIYVSDITRYIYLGTGVLKTDDGEVYTLENKVVFKASKTSEASTNEFCSMTNLDNGTNKFSLTYTNSSESQKTFTHIGRVESMSTFGNTTYPQPSSSRTSIYEFLIWYEELSEPFVVEAGETKTLDVVIDFSNLSV